MIDRATARAETASDSDSALILHVLAESLHARTLKSDGTADYMSASESVALEYSGFESIRDLLSSEPSQSLLASFIRMLSQQAKRRSWREARTAG